MKTDEGDDSDKATQVHIDTLDDMQTELSKQMSGSRWKKGQVRNKISLKTSVVYSAVCSVMKGTL
jgi:hypothetical protein